MAESILGGATYTHNGSITTGDASNPSVIVKIGGTTVQGGGYLVQSVNASVSLQNRTVYEVGSNFYYYIMGRPSGQGSIQHLIGPNRYTFWNDMKSWAGCDPVDLSFSVIPTGTNCPSSVGIVGSEGEIKYTGGYLNSVQMSATAGEIVVTSNLGFTFMDIQRG